jgi:hypothetical protein
MGRDDRLSVIGPSGLSDEDVKDACGQRENLALTPIARGRIEPIDSLGNGFRRIESKPSPLGALSAGL